MKKISHGGDFNKKENKKRRISLCKGTKKSKSEKPSNSSEPD